MSGGKIMYVLRERYILDGTGTTLQRGMEALFSYSRENTSDIPQLVIFCIIFLGNFMSAA